MKDPRPRRWLKPPVFPDEETTRVARLLHWILLVALVLNLFDMGVLLIFAPETLPTFWVNGVILLVTLFSFWLMRRGNVLAASILLCAITWLLTTFYIFISGGVTSPAFGFLYLFIIVAAVLLGAEGAEIFGVLCILTAVTLYVGGNNGLLTNVEAPPAPGRLFATHTAILLGLTLLMGGSGRNVRNALDRARQGERDLAERNQQLQQEITRREQAQQEQARLAAILEATSDFVAMGDPQGNIVFLNRGGRSLYEVEEDADLRDTTITNYHPPAISELIVNEALPAAIRDGTWSGETILRTRAGRDIPVSQVVIVHRGKNGEVEFLSTIIRDLTDRKEAEHQRLELALQEERLVSFREFLSEVSHDLRTPMAVVQTSLYMLERLQDPERRQEKIDNIRDQVSLLEKYINNVLELTRLNRAPEFSFTPLDVTGLLDEIHAHFAVQAEERSIRLEFRLDSSVPPVMADKQELYRALANLIDNAIQYTVAGGSVSVQTHLQESEVNIQVSDTGIGIDPQELPHIFERFYRSEQAQAMRSNGTGLGLAIVKRIVEVHSGRIEVESALGAGTTFVIHLPQV